MSIEKDEVKREITFKPSADEIDDDRVKIRVTRIRDECGTEITVWIDDRIAFSFDGDDAEMDAKVIAELLQEAVNNKCCVEKS